MTANNNISVHKKPYIIVMDSYNTKLLTTTTSLLINELFVQGYKIHYLNFANIKKIRADNLSEIPNMICDIVIISQMDSLLNYSLIQLANLHLFIYDGFIQQIIVNPENIQTAINEIQAEKAKNQKRKLEDLQFTHIKVLNRLYCKIFSQNIRELIKPSGTSDLDALLGE